MQKVKLIIGLGNPGEQYEQTFHNVGYLMVDFLAGKSEKKLVKTDTFMNKSGEFVKKLITKEKIKSVELLIVHDDSDIELGRSKYSFGRNSAGHKGVQNIIDQLKTNQFWRLRIGIRPARNKEKADELVLKKITPAKKEILEKVFQEAAKQLL